MKYVWEEGDIRAGRRVTAYNLSEEYIIGYDPKIHGRNTQAFALTSLSDGMIAYSEMTAIAMADKFNHIGMRPLGVEDKNA